jgi:hypothetical protein
LDVGVSGASFAFPLNKEQTRSVQIGCHTCWMKNNMPQMYCWPLQIFSDQGEGGSSISFLQCESGCTHIMHD